MVEQRDHDHEAASSETRRQDSRTYERLYTPPDDEKGINFEACPSGPSAEITEWMLRLKQEQRDRYDGRDAGVLGEGKDADHLKPEEMQRIEQGYMPALAQIETKLRGLDADQGKKPRKMGQGGQRGGANADKNRVRGRAIAKFVDGIHRQQEFFGVAKHVTEPIIMQREEEDPKAKFYVQCQQEGVVAMPTLAKIKDKVLNLAGYKMNLGLCKALGRAFLLYHDVLEKLLLESTGTDDEMLAAILEGLREQVNFKSVTYKRNIMDQLSVRALVKLAHRPVPHNLDEVRIINCRITP